MNELYAIDADVTLGFRVQLMNKIVVVGLMFSFAIPILYLLVFFFLWSAHWVDRYTFLRRLTPPPVTHDGLMEVVLNYIFPAAIILHLVMSVIFFNDICAGSKNAHSMCDKIFGDVSTGNPFSVNGSDTCSNVDALGSTSIKSLFESQYDWEENAPFSIESATIHSLECLVSNQTEVWGCGSPDPHPTPPPHSQLAHKVQIASTRALPLNLRMVRYAWRYLAARSRSQARILYSSLVAVSSRF